MEHFAHESSLLIRHNTASLNTLKKSTRGLIAMFKGITLAFVVLMAFVLVACSSADDSRFAGLESSADFAAPQAPAAAPAPSAPAFALAPPRPAASAPAPAAPARAPSPNFGGADGDESISKVTSGGGSTEEQAASAAQNRIIVRTVDMTLIVDNVAASIDEIADLATRSRGWVVSSDRSPKHRGFVSIRVPADSLDGSIESLRNLATEVESEITSSEDVTDEFVDLSSRLTNLEATEVALLRLLDRANRVEDALAVQRELTRIQEEIERIQGRLKFLQETAAFSLININLEVAPVDMTVDAGLDQTFAVGDISRFRASFVPPEGIEDFTFTWDFGDGSPEITNTRTAPAPEAGTRFTTTVTHQYFDDRDSPFIAQITMKGTGDAGVAEGEDTIIVTVTKIPVIEVFAGESHNIEEGESISFEASFTRPEGLSELTFEWDFGDGSELISGSLAENVTTVTADHIYTNHRPASFNVTLTIKAQSEAGEAMGTDSSSVFVAESRGWVVSGFSFSDAVKSGVRSLSAVVQVLLILLLWLVIFSPLWLIVGAGLFFLIRRRRRRRALRQIELDEASESETAVDQESSSERYTIE